MSVELEDGRQITCSVDHPWLAKRRWQGKGQQGPGSFEWRESLLLKPGDRLASPFRTWDRETSFDAGWLSGILDGEGCVSGRRTARYPTPTLTVGQNPGPALDRIESILGAMGIDYLHEKNHAGNRGGKKYDCVVLRVRPRSQAIELLGRLQPVRLNAAYLWEDMPNQPRTAIYGVVKSVTPVEDSEVVSMKTSSATYIAEGLVSHNCDNAWAELGKRTGLIRYCPEAVIEHRHWQVCADTPHDEVYREAEDAHGTADLEAFKAWQGEQMKYEVARLRRRFNKDLDWVIGRIGGHGLAAA